MSIYLVRHCSAVGQEPEAELSDIGQQQALLLAHFLADRGVARILSSPFKRAVDSALPLATALGLSIEEDLRLAERQLGHVADGDWVAALQESFTQRDLCLPNGESSETARSRGSAVVREALKDSRLPAAIFSHGNLLTLIAHSFDESIGFAFWQSLSNPDVFELTGKPGAFQLRRVWR